MSVPAVTSTYPTDLDVGIPVGATILVYFDKGVDKQSVIDSVVLYGADSDQTSGSDSALWIDHDTGNNPYYLTSPGFKGVVPVLVELAYYTLSTTTEVDPGVITSEADETTATVGHVAKITVDPKFSAQLSGDLSYTLHIVGDPDTQGLGISSRTVFDVVAGGGNTGLGEVESFGPFTDVSSDTVNVKITKAGDIGVAKYKWWYTSLGEGSAELGKITSPRYRNLDNGLKIRFGGSGYILNDDWTFGVEPIERLATSTTIVFTTNDGSFTAAPASPSTPATSSPPSTVLPSSVAYAFSVDGMSPLHASYNNSSSIRTIVVTFSQDLDVATITDTSVKLWNYPVSGYYDDTSAPAQLQKTLSVSGAVLTITF